MSKGWDDYWVGTCTCVTRGVAAALTSAVLLGLQKQFSVHAYVALLLVCLLLE